MLVTEILERFTEISLENSKKAFVIYQNFVNLTDIMKNKADLIMTEFEFTMKMPNYYTPEAGLV